MVKQNQIPPLVLDSLVSRKNNVYLHLDKQLFKKVGEKIHLNKKTFVITKITCYGINQIPNSCFIKMGLKHITIPKLKFFSYKNYCFAFESGLMSYISLMDENELPYNIYSHCFLIEIDLVG